VDAMREHVGALKRHMENTSAYLKKEVKAVEVKIDEAKAIMLKNVGVNIDEEETLVDMEEAKHIADREIREDEAEEEEDDEDERDTTMIVP
jgi:hypothetical protein